MVLQEAPDLSMEMVSQTILCSVSSIIGCIFEYFQAFLNIIFIANNIVTVNGKP